MVYPNTRDMQVLFDQGDYLISGTVCKDAKSNMEQVRCQVYLSCSQ